MPLYLTRFSYTPATWAKLIKNPEDRRAAILAITEEGSRRLGTIADLRRREVLERLSGWSDEDLKAFVDVMARYNNALER